jgi:hypothetical protein
MTTLKLVPTQPLDSESWESRPYDPYFGQIGVTALPYLAVVGAKISPRKVVRTSLAKKPTSQTE